MLLHFENWGLIDYNLALTQQEKYLNEVKSGERSPTVIFCSHPPIVTLGRATREGDITEWKGSIAQINRGGRATYHGPSQIVIYPIIPLDYSTEQRCSKDIGAFLRQLEISIVDVLLKFGINAQGRSLQDKNGTQSEETGVWVDRFKIASIGVSIRQWVSYHGIAINVDDDPTAFFGILPCGFNPSIMTNVEKLIHCKPDRNRIIEELKIAFQYRL